jgi:hypothetical protein
MVNGIEKMIEQNKQKVKQIQLQKQLLKSEQELQKERQELERLSKQVKPKKLSKIVGTLKSIKKELHEARG